MPFSEIAEAIQAKAQELDLRRQAQIQRQVESINRLLGWQDPGQYEAAQRAEMLILELHEKLADADRSLEDARARLTYIGKIVNDRLEGVGGALHRQPGSLVVLRKVKEVLENEVPDYKYPIR